MFIQVDRLVKLKIAKRNFKTKHHINFSKKKYYIKRTNFQNEQQY
jgi:hypothetical protein